jgi:predicted ribosomally synthesized peptide with SipW-like signal peptide
MKTKSKALLMTLCAVLLVAASVLGTMAYLTSQDSVTNTFSIGKIAITLDEKDVDSSTPGAERDKANAYHLLPGQTYIKDPTVHVKGDSEDAYIFVKVENDIAAIEADGNKIADQIVTTNGWKQLTNADGAVVANVYYKEYTKNAAQQDLVVFSNFKIADNIGAGTLKDYENKTITITAYAIQKDANLDTAAKAWAAGNFGA